MLKQFALLASALMLFSTPLMAAMPLQSEDTGTQGKGHSQIEIGFESTRDKESETGTTCKLTGGVVGAALTYGVTDQIDLVAAMPWIWFTEKEDGVKIADENGFGDVELRLKWRIMEQGDGRVSLAVMPMLTLPTGDEDKALGPGKVTGGVRLVATHEAELTSMHFNIGYHRNAYKLDEDEGSRKDIWMASVAAELNVTDTIKAVADWGIETSENENESDPMYLLGGVIVGVSDNADLDIGIKGGLNKEEIDTTLLAGVTMRF